jgi:uncharacterized protein (TIGR03083 family)
VSAGPLLPGGHAAAMAALPAAAERTVELVRSIPDPATPIPGSDWTVGEAAAHLGVVARAFAAVAAGQPVGPTGVAPDLDDFHERLAQVNARAIAAAPARDPDRLGDRLGDGIAAFLRAVAERPGEDLVETPWYGRGVTCRLDTLTCLAIGEVVVHGYDIARALRRPWPIDPEHARLVVAGVFPAMVPLTVDTAATAGLRAAYELRVRGGPRFVVRFQDGAASVEPAGGGPVDCWISADPTALLLLGYGRTGPWGPIARGRLLAGGRRPWLALRFQRLLRNP